MRHMGLGALWFRWSVAIIVALALALFATACSSGSGTNPATTAAPDTSPNTSPNTSAPGPCDGLSTPDTGATDASAPDVDIEPDVDMVQGCLRLNQVQVIGTHNSYKLAVPEPIFPVLAAFDPELAAELEYWHPPLADQFSQRGVRQIELDVFADPNGGLFAARVGLDVVGVSNDAPPELFEPGFKVLHVQDLDYATSCLTFVACLEEVKAWSDAHPAHVPVAVLVELKEAPIPDPINAGFVQPVPFDSGLPDDVRGAAPTLEAAVLAGGWLTLAEAAGTVIFLMDNGGELRNLYLDGRPSLEGRILFTNATPGDADAAFVKVNDPLGNEERIRDLVRAGYFASIPGGTVARCNPVNTGPRCVDRLLDLVTR